MAQQRNALTSKKYLYELVNKRIKFYNQLPAFFYYFDLMAFLLESFPVSKDEREEINEMYLPFIVNELNTKEEYKLNEFKENLLKIIDFALGKFLELDFDDEGFVAKVNQRFFNLFELKEFDYSFERMTETMFKHKQLVDSDYDDLDFVYIQPNELFSLLNKSIKGSKITDYIEKDTILNFLEEIGSQQYSDTNGDCYTEWDVSKSFMLNLAKEIDYAIEMVCKYKGLKFSTFVKSEKFKMAYKLFFKLMTEILGKNR